MADAIATSFATLNYSGMLFNKGNTRTPLTSIIGARRRPVQAVEFVTGQTFTTEGGTQPAISETASLTAPESTIITRAQLTNVTQIFQESVYVAYAKMANMQTLAGVNIGGQSPNPPNELDFQVAAKMAKIARDIEFTALNGAYNKATTDGTINKSRGLLTAITTNTLDASAAALRVWTIADLMKMVYEAQGDISNLVVWLDAVSMYQLHADAEANGLTIVPSDRATNGIALSSLLTPMGQVSLKLGEFLPAGTVGLFNLGVCGIVDQPTPGKGNFFMEELSKTGAGEKYQIFGQLGIDHGPEWFHAKVTNLATTFTKPAAGKQVFIMNESVPTVSTVPVLETVTLSGAVQVGVESTTLDLTWIGATPAAPTLAYQWQTALTVNGAFTNVAGATSATITPLVGIVGKYLRCKVTSTGTGTGVLYSNAVVVAAAG